VAEFDAGSIEARLELNRDAFTAGLVEARRQADEFEAKPIKARLEVDTGDSTEKIGAVKTELDDVPKEKTTKLKADASSEQLTLWEEELKTVPKEKTTQLKAKVSAADEAELVAWKEEIKSIPSEKQVNISPSPSAVGRWKELTGVEQQSSREAEALAQGYERIGSKATGAGGEVYKLAKETENAGKSAENSGSKFDGLVGKVETLDKKFKGINAPGGGLFSFATSIQGLFPLMEPLLGLGVGLTDTFTVAASSIGIWGLFAKGAFKEFSDASTATAKAQDELTKATDKDGKARAAAQDLVTNAQDRLAAATDRSSASQQSAYVRLAKANQDLAKAQQDVQNTALDPKKHAAALEELRRAQDEVASATVAVNKAQTDPRVLSATDKLTEAQKKLAAAETDPARKKALDDLAAATAAMPPSMAKVYQEWVLLKDEFHAMSQDVAPGISSVFDAAIKVGGTILPQLRPIVDGVSGALKDVLGQVNDFMNGPVNRQFLTFLSQQGPKLIRDMGGGFVGILSNFATLAMKSQPLMQATGDLFDRVISGFGKMTTSKQFSDWVNAISKDMPKFGNVMGDLFKGLGDFLVHLEPIIPPLLDFLDKVIKALDELIRKGTLDAIVRLATTILDVLGPVLPSLADFLNSAIPLIADVLVPVLEALKPILPEIAPIILSIWAVSKVLGPLQEILKIMQTIKALGALSGIGISGGTLPGEKGKPGREPGAVEKGAAGVGVIGLGAFGGYEAAGPLQQATGEEGPGTQRGVARGLTRGGTATLGAAAGMAVTGVGAIPAAFVAAAGAAQIAAGEIVAHWSGVRKFFQTLGSDIKSSFNQAWHDSSVFMSRMWKDITTFAGRIYRDVVGWFKRMWDDVKQSFNQAWHDTSVFMGRIWHDVTGFVVRIFNDVVGWFKRMWDDVKQSFNQAWHDVVVFAERIWRDVTGFASRLWHDFTGWIKRTVDDSVQFFKDLPGKIVAAFGDAIHWLEQAGKDIINGLKNGVQWGWDNVLKPAWNGIIDAIPGHFADGLKAHSPSEVFRDLGQTIPAGIALGITQGWDDVQAALRQSLPTPQVAGAAMAGGGTHSTVNITINNPVGETTDASLHRTMQKIRFHGLTPPELWAGAK